MDYFAVAIMTEDQESGVMDLIMDTVQSHSREEAIGIMTDKHQGGHTLVHRVRAIFIGSGEDSQIDARVEEYLSLLREGKKIHAIKLYREHSGLDLKDAKDWIDNLQSKHGAFPH
jgi:ribosomal protein L7/L12